MVPIGKDFGTYDDEDYHGGIWNITEDMLKSTIVRSASAQKKYFQIFKYFKIAWRRIKWEHMRIPIYSGLAARLYAYFNIPEIPRDVSNQAAWWVKLYSSPAYRDYELEEITDDLRQPFLDAVEVQEEMEG